MNTLNLGSDEIPEKKKKSNTRNLKIALGLAAVILVPTIGSTLAGQINIGTGSIEFGQGVLDTAACDSAINVLPQSALVGGEFVATTIAVTNVGIGCDYKMITIKVLEDEIPQVIGSDNETACMFLFHATEVASTFTTNISGECTVIEDWDPDLNNEVQGFTFTPGTSVASSKVEAITLESSNF
jgi:hypothetical protein